MRRPIAKAKKGPGAKAKKRPAAKAEKRPTAKAKKRPTAKAKKRPTAKAKKRPAAKAKKRPAAKARRRPAAKAKKRPVAKANKAGPKSGALAEAITLRNPKELLKSYYAGLQLESPNGGFLIPLAVTPGRGGTAVALFECSASSLRYKLNVPKATSTERRKVREVMKAGSDPDCPRHGPGQRLVRVDKDLACNLCGVVFARA